MPDPAPTIDTDPTGWRSQVPRLSDYFGLWAMPERTIRPLLDQVQGMDILAHIRAAAPSPGMHSETDYRVTPKGTAVVGLRGILMKGETSLGDGTSTVAVRRQLRAAREDPNVRAVLLHIESPGGMHDGTKELADEVTATNAVKPVVAWVEDIAASAAYWPAAQASKIYANATGFVGSIGTLLVVTDSSKAATAAGIQVHAISTGPFKGAGTPGTEVTAEHLAQWQKQVDQSAAFFIQAVADGRSLAVGRVRELADGSLHIAAEAAALGLIDGVRTLDQVLDEIEQEQPMSTAQQTSATFAELKAACPDASPAFLCSALEKGQTVDEARAAHMKAMAAESAELKAQVEQATKAAEAAKAEAAEAAASAKPRLGVDPIETTGATANAGVDSDDPFAAFDAIVRKKMAGGLERRKAILAAARQNPELHREFLKSRQKNDGARRNVEERFSA